MGFPGPDPNLHLALCHNKSKKCVDLCLNLLKNFGTEKSLGIGLKNFGTEKSLGISIVQILGHTLFGKSVKMSPV